jgi:hypothetical protein
MTDQVTNENILRKCIVCQEEKETSKFRLNRTTCRKCCSKSQNAVLKNKNYFADKYQEKHDQRLEYQNKYYQEKRKPILDARRETERKEKRREKLLKLIEELLKEQQADETLRAFYLEHLEKLL